MEPIQEFVEDYGDIANPDSDSEYKSGKTEAELSEYIDNIYQVVRTGMAENIERLTPWFFSNMPRIYYETTPREEKIRHLFAVVSGSVFEHRQTVELWNETNTKVNYIGPGEDRLVLVEMARKLTHLNLKMGSIYFSKDRSLFLSSFICRGYKKPDMSNPHISTKIIAAKEAMLKASPGFQAEIENYLEQLDHDFVAYATTARIQDTFRMLLHMLYHEGAHTIVEPFQDSNSIRLTIGYKGVSITQVLEHILHCLTRYDFNIGRAFGVEFEHGFSESIVVIHFVIRYRQKSRVDSQEIALNKLVKGLRTLGSVDSDAYNLLSQAPFELSLNGANFIRSVSSWVHILLGKENSYYYSDYKIHRTFLTYPEVTLDLVELFRIRFSPLRQADRDSGEYQRIRNKILDSVEELLDRVEVRIFRESVKFVDHVLKTNYFIHTKTGLAFRLDPDVLDPQYYPNKPFGIFFVTGRDYRCFQVRWKDVARGGLRVVMPKNTTDYQLAMAGLFDEVYGLSFAQQLKNKDIPEGGSKAVLVLRPEGERTRAVKSCVNGLLDLLVSEDESHEESISKQVSYYKDEEIIYLGPDENITNDLISWITDQAARRGYKYANAFMSSKVGQGINHKEYGVTSEGLNVFVEHTLRFIGIDPRKQKFSIKMTGGPDGDVAGNELKILHREFGENARVVAIADGFGAAYDPQGLNWKELLRLVKEGRSIAEFDPSFLSSRQNPELCFVIRAETNETIKKRNVLHASVYADIFIPAGGRPYTVNEMNYKQFISHGGETSCKAIVEGANIFFTAPAREKLQESGIIMIKDSSANKAGVVCSSYEIIASLILTPKEFMEIKAEYVPQVIAILKDKARLEAKLLFNELAYSRGRKNLVQLSTEISKEINSVTDAFLEYLLEHKERILADVNYQSIILRHCPKILREKYRDRILEKLPQGYQIAIISASIASSIVYLEGLDWLQPFGDELRLQVAMSYLENNHKTELIIDALKDANIRDKEQIIAILRRSGSKELTQIAMEKTLAFSVS